MSPFETNGNVTSYTRTTSLEVLKDNFRKAMDKQLAYKEPIEFGPNMTSTKPRIDITAEWIKNHIEAIMSVKDTNGVSAVDHLSVALTSERKGVYLFTDRNTHVYLLSDGQLAEVIINVTPISQNDAAIRYGGRNVCDALCETATKLSSKRTSQLKDDD